MPQLYLVGTNHSDLKGPERLEKFLEIIRPEHIGVEYTEKDAQTIIRLHQKNLITKYDTPKELIEGRKRYTQGYEVWVSDEFRKSNPETNVSYLEDQLLSDEADNYLGSDVFKIDKSVNAIYDNQSFIRKIKNYPEIFAALFLNRDEHFEKEIRKIYPAGEQTMAYICGALHFFGEYHNLYERLRDLNPVRIKLRDLDKFQ